VKGCPNAVCRIVTPSWSHASESRASCRLSLPLALLEWPRFNPETLQATIWSLTVWYALSSSVLCPLLWYRGLPHIDASIAGLATSAMLVTALLVSAVALGEALNPLRIAGATLVVVAIVLGATEGGTQRRTFD
jgi:drug/metabolite transporter (DMT)-like permease